MSKKLPFHKNTFHSKRFIFLVLLVLFNSWYLSQTAMAQDNEKQKYHLDPSQGEFLVKTGSGGVFGAFGHKHTISIRNFSGTLQFDPAHLENSSLEMNIQADQLEVVPSKKDDKDKPKIEKEMRENVLEVAEYPEIHFKSTSISAKKLTPDNYEVKIMGDLTLHGVTRNIPINAKVTMLENEVKAKGDFSLLQTDYKIKPYSAAGGTVKVKNKLDFAFDMVAHP